jgi:hypothetical protein
MTGILTLNAFDVSLTDMAFPGIGEGISLATLAAFVGTVATDDNTDSSTLSEDVQNLGQYYVAAVLISVGGLVDWV